MTVKFNRTNHNFQIAYFIAGDCHTPDAAYIALVNQRQEKSLSIDSIESVKLKQQAERMRCQRRIDSDDEVEQLEGRATLLELEILVRQYNTLLAAAHDELDFINQCIERIQPYRKYSHLSDAETAEACQHEEWLLELRRRAENYLLTAGTIPHDQFNALTASLAHIFHMINCCCTGRIVDQKIQKFGIELFVDQTGPGPLKLMAHATCAPDLNIQGLIKTVDRFTDGSP